MVGEVVSVQSLNRRRRGEGREASRDWVEEIRKREDLEGKLVLTIINLKVAKLAGGDERGDDFSDGERRRRERGREVG